MHRGFLNRPIHRSACLLTLGASCLGPAFPVRAADAVDAAATIESTAALPALLGFTNVAGWSPETPSQGARTDTNRLILRSPLIRAAAPWNELVVSWNVQPPEGAGLVVEAQAIGTGTTNATGFYSLGRWSLGSPVLFPRTSVRAPRDAYGRVETDTLILNRPTHAVRLRLNLHGALANHPERLRLLTLSLCNSRARSPLSPTRAGPWNRTLEVPERSQVAYAGGRAWCSPTSVAMILGWWARELGRPELARDVPEVAAGVDDPAWPGTGNWPFNTAYVGSFPGLVACAARLPDLRAVEDLIAAGLPVALSVNAPAMRGEPILPDEGHLVVCIGFNDGGDVVVNDPWTRLDEGQHVRRIYRRENVDRAWQHSLRLVYLVAPESKRAALPIEWH